MQILGLIEDGVLIVPVEKLILTNTLDRFTFPADTFTNNDRASMMDNPHEAHSGILVHNSSVTQGRIKDVGLACEFRFIRLNDDSIELNVTGVRRVHIVEHKVEEGRLIALDIVEAKCPNTKPEVVENLAQEIIEFVAAKNEKLARRLKRIKDPSRFADTVLDGVLGEENNRKKMLNELSILSRTREAHSIMLNPEDSKPKEFKSSNPDVQCLIDKFKTLTLNKKANDEILTTLKTLIQTRPDASEYPVQLRYAEFALGLPWGVFTEDNPIEEVEKTLEAGHYGMKKAKERLIEHMAIHKMNPDANGLTVLLDGAPGTGKTTLALALGKAMGRKVERISLGGCTDPSVLKGHDRTYSGSRYGRIMQAIHAAGSMNPVIVLDEVEKVGVGSQGDAAATLLEILDPKTNNSFQDNYLGFEFDLSKVIFIATSNDRYAISPPVFDRMEFIPCEGYTMNEKIKIALDYTIPAKAKDMGIEGTTIAKPLLKHIIEGYTREAGVRSLEKLIGSCLRKIAVERSKGKNIKLTKKIVTERLGQPMAPDALLKHTEPGIVTGMYYSTAGGGCLNIEAIITDLDGEGHLAVTGQCGSVMLESIELVKAHMTATDYGMNGENLDRWNIHLHMPEGSTPKDGPSAGGAYSLLFASLLMNRPVRPNLALTGECNLHGHITAIGGVDQKCAGAIRAGMTTICLPKANKRDYEELPKYIKEAATFHFVETVEELLDIAFDYSDLEDDNEERTERLAFK